MLEQVADRDRRGARQLGKVRGDGLVEAEPPALGELHDRGRRRDLRHREPEVDGVRRAGSLVEIGARARPENLVAAHHDRGQPGHAIAGQLVENGLQRARSPATLLGRCPRSQRRLRWLFRLPHAPRAAPGPTEAPTTECLHGLDHGKRGRSERDDDESLRGIQRDGLERGLEGREVDRGGDEDTRSGAGSHEPPVERQTPRGGRRRPGSRTRAQAPRGRASRRPSSARCRRRTPCPPRRRRASRRRPAVRSGRA